MSACERFGHVWYAVGEPVLGSVGFFCRRTGCTCRKLVTPDGRVQVSCP